MNKLPIGWAKVPLDELGDWGSGGTPRRSNSWFYSNGTIPWLVIGDLNDDIVAQAQTYITEEGLLNSSAKLLPLNTLLVAMYGSIGKLGITGVECATNQAIAFCVPNPKIIELRYLFNALRYFRGELNLKGKGVSQKNISQAILKAFPIPVAPLNEQKRIVEKLDHLIARVDECRNRLARIFNILRRLRQSVINLAISGQLTENWRSLNEPCDSGHVEALPLLSFLSEPLRNGRSVRDGNGPWVGQTHTRDENIRTHFSRGESCVQPSSCRR